MNVVPGEYQELYHVEDHDADGMVVVHYKVGEYGCIR